MKNLAVDAPAAERGSQAAWAEAVLAVAAFAALCVVVLSVSPQAAEPDDGAYHASIVAMTEGHFLTLSTDQAEALARKLGDNPAAPPNQWVEVTDGEYISEKDPGYPFLAAPFQRLGIIRWAPLFFGALACLGLFIGARRWLGRFGGLAAVGLCWWLASVAVFGAGVAIFNDLVYGGPLTTGYQPGEVTFSLSAIGPNVRLMPAHLMQAMPMLALGLIALAWIVVRRLALRGVDGDAGAVARRDLWVGAALAASWFAIWGLYSAYT